MSIAFLRVSVLHILVAFLEFWRELDFCSCQSLLFIILATIILHTYLANKHFWLSTFLHI